MIPDWNKSDVKLLVKNISGKVDKKYHDIIEECIDLIAAGVEANPREIKRFINNFILSYEIFSRNSEIKAKELFAVQALKMRWNRFYRYFSSYDDCRQLVRRHIGLSVSERRKSIKEIQGNNENPPDELEILLSEIDDDLWLLLKSEENTIYGIKNWELYRRAVELVKDIPSVETKAEVKPGWLPSARVDLKGYELLKSGNVSEFNNLREKKRTPYVDLSGVDLSGAILPQVDLHGAELSSAILNGADLTGANLTKARLNRASFDGAKLDNADFTQAAIISASFNNASLNETIFDYADLRDSKIKSNFLQVKTLRGSNMHERDIDHEIRKDIEKKGATVWG
jgi:pentapeptide repeat protein